MPLTEIASLFATRIIRITIYVVVYKLLAAKKIPFVAIFLLKSEAASRFVQRKSRQIVSVEKL